MTIAYLLLVLGLALIFLEFYLPGAVMGTAGAIFILIALFKLIAAEPGPLAVVLFIAITCISIYGTIRLALWSIKKTKSKGSIYLESDQEGYKAPSYDRSLIGGEAICHTALRPGGFVTIEGKKYDAVSVSGFIEKGKTVKIIDIEGETLKVKL